MKGDQASQQEGRLVHAYRRMVERVKDGLRSESGALGGIQQALDSAKQRAVELGELTTEEAENIAEYLRRDLREAAEYLAQSGDELSRWLTFDLELLGARLADYLQPLVDQTTVELERLREQAEAFGGWRKGEVTMGGTFRCAKCGETVQIQGPARLPGCPSCQAGLFKRVAPPPPG